MEQSGVGAGGQCFVFVGLGLVGCSDVRCAETRRVGCAISRESGLIAISVAQNRHTNFVMSDYVGSEKWALFPMALIEVVNRCRKGETVVKGTKEEDKGVRSRSRNRNRNGNGNGNKQMIRRGQGAR